MVEGYREHKLRGMFRIDCVGCPGSWSPRWGFAHGIVCNPTTRLRMCSKKLGDATDWDVATLSLLERARPHFLSGVLVGVYLGNRL
jgi:hypothetical protein